MRPEMRHGVCSDTACRRIRQKKGSKDPKEPGKWIAWCRSLRVTISTRGWPACCWWNRLASAKLRPQSEGCFRWSTPKKTTICGWFPRLPVAFCGAGLERPARNSDSVTSEKIALKACMSVTGWDLNLLLSIEHFSLWKFLPVCRTSESRCLRFRAFLVSEPCVPSFRITDSEPELIIVS